MPKEVPNIFFEENLTKIVNHVFKKHSSSTPKAIIENLKKYSLSSRTTNLYYSDRFVTSRKKVTYTGIIKGSQDYVDLALDAFILSNTEASDEIKRDLRLYLFSFVFIVVEFDLHFIALYKWIHHKNSSNLSFNCYALHFTQNESVCHYFSSFRGQSDDIGYLAHYYGEAVDIMLSRLDSLK